MPLSSSNRFRPSTKYQARSKYGHRIISALRWAKPCERPACIPLARVRGRKALGLGFERAIAQALPQVRRGQWFEFEDIYGPGYCQTDFIFKRQGHAFILEAKLKDTPAAYRQLAELYIPVVTAAFGLPTHGIVICKHIAETTDVSELYYTLRLAIDQALALAPRIPTVQWLGHGTI